MNEWLLFIYQLPAHPSSLRVMAWRKLREAGAASLQNGVWVLPLNEKNEHFLERLLANIRQQGASGQILISQSRLETVRKDILNRFQEDREQEYAELLEQCESFLTEIEKETANGKFTFAELEENEQNLDRLRKWLAAVQKRDFFSAPKSRDALEAYDGCRNALEAFTANVYAKEGLEAPQGNSFLLDESANSQKDELDTD